MQPYYIETIRLDDGVPQHIAWHQRRLDVTVRDCLGGRGRIDLARLVPEAPPAGVARWRIVYGAEGLVEATAMPYTPRPISSLRLVQADDLEYYYKGCNRAALDALFEARGQADDVLIIRRGQITDTTIASVALGNGERWFVPEQPLLLGTTRWRLECEGRVEARLMRPQDIPRYAYISLFNAMLPLGAVVLPTNRILLG